MSIYDSTDSTTSSYCGWKVGAKHLFQKTECYLRKQDTLHVIRAEIILS